MLETNLHKKLFKIYKYRKHKHILNAEMRIDVYLNLIKQLNAPNCTRKL